jgi:nucleoside-diphosphate-sugar epimerase
MKNSNYYLITGGIGLIGANIIKKIFNNDKKAICVLLDNFTVYIDPLKSAYGDFRKNRFSDILNHNEYIKSRTSKIIVERGNAADPRITTELLEKYRPKIIYHTAAMPLARVNNPVCDEFRLGSVDTTTNLLECIGSFQMKANYKLKRFLYISSSMVYGDFKTHEVRENDELNPKEIYGTMKLAGEIITKGMCRQYDIPYTIIRPSAVYGPTDMNQRVTQYFIEKAIAGEELEIHGKNEKLDFTYVEDLADGCVLAAESKKGENQVFNITFGSARTLLDYAKILKKHFIKLKYKIVPRDKYRPKRGTLNIDKAKRLIGFKPKFNLEKGTELYVKFIKKLKKTYP